MIDFDRRRRRGRGRIQRELFGGDRLHLRPTQRELRGIVHSVRAGRWTRAARPWRRRPARARARPRARERRRPPVRRGAGPRAAARARARRGRRGGRTGAVVGVEVAGLAASPPPPYLVARDLNTSPVAAFNVSSTPWPFMATASKKGRPRGLSLSLRISTGRALGRSRLLYWRTVGISPGSISLASQVLLQVGQRVQVRVQRRLLAVGHEHDAVGALQHQLPGRVVEDLAGDGVELDARLHAPDGAEVDGQEVEEQGAVGLRGQGQHLSLVLDRRLLVDPLEVRGLPAQAGAVIDDLGRQLLRGVVEEDHSPPPSLPAGGSADRGKRHSTGRPEANQPRPSC